MGEREKSTGYRKKVVFISCSASKGKKRAPAHLLYTGTLFKKTLTYAKQYYPYAKIYILSAKYGIIELDEVIEPYNQTLSKMGKNERENWYLRVRKQMLDKNLQSPFIFLTGYLYSKDFIGEQPLEGLSIGRRLQWLNKKIFPQLKTIFE